MNGNQKHNKLVETDMIINCLNKGYLIILIILKMFLFICLGKYYDKRVNLN